MTPDDIRKLAAEAGYDADKRAARMSLADMLYVSERTLDLYLEGKRNPSKPVQALLRHYAAGGTLKGQKDE